ncbi:MAG: spherulation-specific family 4 protein [Pirellulales bacterium]|nr:spherulation-specific family 4 protein [Pirellulales bacterium]
MSHLVSILGDPTRLTAHRRALQCVCGVLVAASLVRSAAALEIVVPAYFYPGPLWTQLNAAAGQVPLTAIMNPFNGPGNSRDMNYVNAVNALRAAGGRVIGYVYSGYGMRPLAEVTADVDRFASWYEIDGIFVDEMANIGPAERLNYYRSLYEHVKGVNPQWEVMGNPGTTTIEQYLTWPAADRLMVFENVGSAYAGHSPSAWNASYDRDRFVNLIHTEPSSANMLAALDLAMNRTVGAMYVTNDVMANPWDTLPSYWTAHVNRVAEINASYDPADFNQNGAADAADLAKWSSNYGATGVFPSSGDATGDRAVAGDDFLHWQRSVSAAVVSASASAIPEPAAAKLALLAFAATMAARCGTERHPLPSQDR